MRRLITLAICLGVTACGPTSDFHDYTTPENAVRSFLEAGRVGDTYSARKSVIASERLIDLHIDYQDLGDYTLTMDSLIEDEKAIVILTSGEVDTPLACLMEDGSWRVSIQGSLQRMQQGSEPKTAAAPR